MSLPARFGGLTACVCVCAWREREREVHTWLPLCFSTLRDDLVFDRLSRCLSHATPHAQSQTSETSLIHRWSLRGQSFHPHDNRYQSHWLNADNRCHLRLCHKQLHSWQIGHSHTHTHTHLKYGHLKEGASGGSHGTFQRGL